MHMATSLVADWRSPSLGAVSMSRLHLRPYPAAGLWQCSEVDCQSIGNSEEKRERQFIRDGDGVADKTDDVEYIGDDTYYSDPELDQDDDSLTSNRQIYELARKGYNDKTRQASVFEDGTDVQTGSLSKNYRSRLFDTATRSEPTVPLRGRRIKLFNI